MSETQQNPVTSCCDHVLLVGAGVVGRAIAVDHLRAGVPVWLADRDEDVLRESCDRVLEHSDCVAVSASPWGSRLPLPVVHLSPTHPSAGEPTAESAPAGIPRWLLIESIAERLDIKQDFFAEAEQWFERDAILTTNTSTLSIASIAANMRSPERLCGLHFFMPVVDRPAVEIIPHRSVPAATEQRPGTTAEVIEACCTHARALDKTPLLVRDAPGFVVNRLLAPYLNLAMNLLCGGVPAETIERAALMYGMPISPLQLVDLIGPRTAFDGGRVVWSAFPTRMDPSPLLPAMVKAKLTGVASGEGFYRYDASGRRLERSLADRAAAIAQKYQHDQFAGFPESEPERTALVADLFAAVLRIEAIAIERDAVADSETIHAAMRGGLRWRADGSHAGPTNCLTSDRAAQLASEFSHLKSIQPCH
ncbi:3-hydroxyacyl-CoA dehydrogenase family protein [Allorhodopirellula solitaria]|uniref:Fatty acid oxidation complex subunit alpha n=1 Tax=Allorhodopirellula solitaria TaxID=2527987 RepID=A0A5C5X1V2_9BACT|nr:3-hydroxyacyl-CoA dehydrogenase family protein [Allorhodopirellula solitaria]TWT56143.1 Fatty acid oxidation complex subunit alpha [Allorhodopirellula solitaria]